MIIKKNGPVIVTVHKVTTDEAGTTVGEWNEDDILYIYRQKIKRINIHSPYLKFE